jgi:uncharacterized protein
MEKNAIIIFVRNPELGKVKTRLAGEIGTERALAVYRELLQHTHDTVLRCIADKFVFYADTVIENDLWENEFFEKKGQNGHDLGTRMSNAFAEVFNMGYKSVLIIGSDCPELVTGLLDKAFAELETIDVVIGPAADGGYYLLGLNEPSPLLFENKEWSTGSVLDTTVRDTLKSRKKYFLLPRLADVDTKADMDNWKSRQIPDQSDSGNI